MFRRESLQDRKHLVAIVFGLMQMDFGVGGTRVGMAHHIPAAGVVADQMVGQQCHPVAVTEGVAEGLLQRAFKLITELAQNELGPGTTEFVDGLVRVADHGYPGAVTGHITQKQVLDLVGVLVLVHQDQIHFVTHQALQWRVLMDGHHRLIQHVGVADTAFAFTPLLEGMEQVDQVAVFVGVAQLLEHHLRGCQPGFDPVDKAGGGFDKILLVAADFIGQFLRCQPPGQQPGLEADLLFGQDLFRKARQIAFPDKPTIQPQAHGVVGTDFRQRQPALLADGLQLAFEVYLGAAVEHQHQHPVRVVALGQQVADAPGQRGGFTTARHGRNHRMLVTGRDDGALLVGQVIR